MLAWGWKGLESRRGTELPDLRKGRKWKMQKWKMYKQDPHGTKSLVLAEQKSMARGAWKSETGSESTKRNTWNNRSMWRLN